MEIGLCFGLNGVITQQFGEGSADHSAYKDTPTSIDQDGQGGSATWKIPPGADQFCSMTSGCCLLLRLQTPAVEV